MRLDLRRALAPFARALQQAYGRAIRGATAKERPDGKPTGGSLTEQVQRPALVRLDRAGFTFAPSRLGDGFKRWWFGTGRQPARGSAVAIDEARLARAIEDELVRQIEAQDGDDGRSA